MMIFKKKRITEEAQALLEMYKAGFLDGYKFASKTRIKKVWEWIKEDCKKAFDKRFNVKFKKGVDAQALKK